MMEQKLSKNQKQIMDRVLPISLVCVILPLIVRLHIYTEDLSGCHWFGFDIYFADFFNYAKDIVFYAVVLWMLAKLLWERLQGRKAFVKNQYMLLFGVVCIFYFLSSIFAEDTSLSWNGGYQSFQGFFVLAGYLVLCVYAYERMEHGSCVMAFYWCNVWISAVSCIIGFLQIVGCDPFFWPFVQRIILPDTYAGAALESQIRSNTVYLTLGNPNYASIFLAAQIILTSIFLITNKNRGKKFLLGVLDAGLLVCEWFTYSRVGLLMIFTAAVAGMLLCRKQWKPYCYKLLLAGAFTAAGLLLLDAVTGFRFIERLEGTARSFTVQRKNCNIDDLCTGPDGIFFTQNGKSIRIYAPHGLEQNGDIQIETSGGIDVTEFYAVDTGALSYKGLEEVFIYTETIDEKQMIVLRIGETWFRFAKDEEDGYLLYVGNGKYDTVQPVERLGFAGIEHIASGRPYIWSRTLPLLKKYWLLGCGADNFFLIYPQNDYLGKAQYCSDPLTIVEKPHSAYLKLAVEQGIFPLVFLLAAYGLFARREWMRLRKKESYTDQQWLELGCFLVSIAYMAGFLFNDWNINVMPLFWMAVGIAAGRNTG